MSLCDTALTTSQIGYSQRKLIKLMEKMVVHNDGSVRCVCSKKIYEEAFGGEGIDPCKKVFDPNWLKRAMGNLCPGRDKKNHQRCRAVSYFSGRIFGRGVQQRKWGQGHALTCSRRV